MTLADFTSEQLCLPESSARDAPAVLSELSRALERAHVVPGSLTLFNVALNEHFFAEADHLDAAAYSIARLPSLPRIGFALAHTRKPCWWRHGAAPVRLVFLVATAPAFAAVTSAVVVSLKRLFIDQPRLESLRSASSGAQMLSALGGIPLDDAELVPPFASACGGAEARK